MDGVTDKLQNAPPKSHQLVGNNVVIFSPGDMMKAMQWYLNAVVLKTPVKVLSVHENSSTHNYTGFEIKIAPLED